MGKITPDLINVNYLTKLKNYLISLGLTGLPKKYEKILEDLKNAHQNIENGANIMEPANQSNQPNINQPQN